MKRAGLSSILIAVTLLAVAVIADAQQAKKVPRIGYLTGSSPSARSARIEAFGQGLRDLGTWREKTSLLSIDMQREN